MLKTVADIISEAKKQVNCIDAQKAKTLFQQGSVIIIDVREPGEVAKSSLQQSINIPRGLLEMKIGKHCQDENQLILIHCAAGGRASLAALALKQMGYQNVHAINDEFEIILNAFN